MRIGSLISGASSDTGRLLPLAVVPFFTSVVRWTDVVAVGTASGEEFGVTFGLPQAVPDLWTFLGTPSPDGNGLMTPVPFLTGGSARLATVAVLLSALVFVAVQGVVMAGFLGSIDQFVREGRYDVVANVRRFAARMVAFQAVVFCSLLALIAVSLAVGLVSPPLAIVGFAVGLVVWLLVYLTPFLVVVADLPLLAAFRRSVRLATGGIEPVAFAAGYALVIAVISVPVSIITNAGIPGVVLAAAIVSPIGLFLAALTVRFTRALLPSVDHDRTTIVHGTH